jgi:hypothetical protein
VTVTTTPQTSSVSLATRQSREIYIGAREGLGQAAIMNASWTQKPACSAQGRCAEH